MSPPPPQVGTEIGLGVESLLGSSPEVDVAGTSFGVRSHVSLGLPGEDSCLRMKPTRV